MTDYFEELGISRDASAEEIRAAYRHKAKAAHPDRKGGNSQQMATINRAYETLSDPRRRKAYEETGHDRPPNIESAAREALMACILGHLMNESSSGDLLKAALSTLKEQLKQFTDNRREGGTVLKRIEKRRKKLKFKGKGQDFIRFGLDHHTSVIQQQMNQISENIDKITLAIKLAQDYEFEVDPADEAQYAGMRYFNLEDMFKP